jgi:hypothetical protein
VLFRGSGLSKRRGARRHARCSASRDRIRAVTSASVRPTCCSPAGGDPARRTVQASRCSWMGQRVVTRCAASIPSALAAPRWSRSRAAALSRTPSSSSSASAHAQAPDELSGRAAVNPVDGFRMRAARSGPATAVSARSA